MPHAAVNADRRPNELCVHDSQVYEVGAHVHWLWHFHASLFDAASDICMEEYHLCTHRTTTIKHRSKTLTVVINHV